MRSYLIFSFLFFFCISPYNYSEEPGDSSTIAGSTIDVVVSGFIAEHDVTVLQSFFDGYSSYNGMQFTGRACIHNSTNILNSLSFASENEYDIVIRSYSGLTEAIELAEDFPELQIIMPSGSNNFIESFSGDIENCPVIVTGAGVTHNVTGYTIEFFSIDPTGESLSSFSNGYIAGQIAFLSDFLGLTYDEARLLSRNTASLQGDYDYFDGFGRIDVEAAINTVLPVELTSFTVSVRSGNAELNWRTETEVNNLGFEIERKLYTNSILNNDDSGWVHIGFVPGHGTTTNPQEYFYFDDISNISSTTIIYRLKQIDFNGTFEFSDEVFVQNIFPEGFSLKQNYPNPFNPSTRIKFTIPTAATHRDAALQTTLKVYDILGNKIATLVNEEKSAGAYEVEFDASLLTSGVYYYTISAGDFIETKKMILLR